MEINLENPIFVAYIDVSGMSAQELKRKWQIYQDIMSYDNITTWIIPIKSETKIEIIWQGSKYSTNTDITDFNNLGNLINRFNEVIEVISNGTDDESIKQQLRNLQLKKIIVDDDTNI
jgi:hypothetical protein